MDTRDAQNRFSASLRRSILSSDGTTYDILPETAFEWWVVEMTIREARRRSTGTPSITAVTIQDCVPGTVRVRPYGVDILGSFTINGAPLRFNVVAELQADGSAQLRWFSIPPSGSGTRILGRVVPAPGGTGFIASSFGAAPITLHRPSPPQTSRPRPRP